jgi:hypothetical protein
MFDIAPVPKKKGNRVLKLEKDQDSALLLKQDG